MKVAFKKLKNIYLLSFLIPIVLMMGIFVVRGIFPFGKNSFMFSDMYHQYIPFLTEFWDKLHSGESLSFAWNVGLGSNFVALYGYYLASPFNWLVFFCPENLIIEFMTYFIVLKIGLCGLTFSYYLSKKYETKDLRIVWFGVFYAMSGFIAAYDWNHMWMDCLWLTPLVLLGLEELVTKKKYRLYCLTLTACIFTNYYISIMLCIFLVLYFLLQLFTNGLSFKEKARATLHFGITSLLAGGMAGILLVPVFYAMNVTDFHAISFPKKLDFYFNALEMLARHVPMLPTERGLDHWPNIYCGVLAFILIPIYLLHKKIPLKQKVGRVLLLAFMLLSFSFNMLNFIWHGFNYPDSLPARQSFLYIFLILTMCFEAVHRNGENGRLNRILGVVCGLVLLACCGIFVTTDGLTISVMICAWIFLVGYLLLGILFDRNIARRLGNKMSLRKLAMYGKWVILLLVCVEAVLNMEATSVGTVQRGYYTRRKAEYRELLTKLDDTDEFYRIDSMNQMTKNDGTLVGYPSISVFSSTINGRVEDFYDNLGMGGSKVSYFYRGATPLSSALMGVRYVFSGEEGLDEELYELVGQSGTTYLYRCRQTASIGYFFDAEKKESLEEVLGVKNTNAITVQNELAEALTDSNDRLLSALTGDEWEIVDNTLTAKVKEDGHIYALVNKTPEGDVMFTQEAETKELKNVSRDCLLDLGYFGAEDSFTIVLEEEEGTEDDELSMRLYRMDTEVLENSVNVLNQESFLIDSYTTDEISGKIEVTFDGYLILSVPYEPGWEIFVDGERAEFETFADTLIAVPVTAGSHTIRMHYTIQGVWAGLGLSVVSLILFLAIYMRDRLLCEKVRPLT